MYNAVKTILTPSSNHPTLYLDLTLHVQCTVVRRETCDGGAADVELGEVGEVSA